MRRHLMLVAVCLPLCGFGSCSRFIQADQQAGSARARCARSAWPCASGSSPSRRSARLETR
ncbi:hypothetical protein ACN28S_28610 [Cystobacter fuscus]